MSAPDMEVQHGRVRIECGHIDFNDDGLAINCQGPPRHLSPKIICAIAEKTRLGIAELCASQLV